MELWMNSPSWRKVKTNAKGTIIGKLWYLYIWYKFVKRRGPGKLSPSLLPLPSPPLYPWPPLKVVGNEN
jgi:hypothetical protein